MAGLIRSPLVTNLDSRISILCWLMEVLGRKGLKWRLPWNGNSRKGLKLRLLPVTFSVVSKIDAITCIMKAKPVQIPSECCRHFECTKKKRKKLFFFSFRNIWGWIKTKIYFNDEIWSKYTWELFILSIKKNHIYIYIIKLFYSLVRSFNFYGYQGIVDENRNVGIFITS